MFLWSKLSAAKWADAWEERMAHLPGLVIEFLKGARSVRVMVYSDSKAEVTAIQEQWGGSVREIKSSEWNRPVPPPRAVKVRDRLLITSIADPDAIERLRSEVHPREVITIPAEMAFGTGDHATTSTCLRLLVDIAKRRRGTDWSAVDLGTGTGLLAIAARKLGAGRISACDFDPFAVEAARRNVQLNLGASGAAEFQIEEADVLALPAPESPYDLVMANLFSTVLIQAWPKIAPQLAPGGDLLVSGILASQGWEVFEAAARCGLGFPKIIRKGKWLTAHGGHLADLTA